MVRRLLPLLLVATAAVPSVASRADTLLMEGVAEAAATAAERPRRGMTMDQVRARWGEPRAQQPAVGDPPISRWDYDDFVVFFEYSRVIHAVRPH
ncbi:MAG: hypothetical protein D6727_08530 [Gammaproteobacteria bacterium]|nr:MAG: hypothetical protein D6727_08530 [Gammaproteobacteria bacterium]